MPTAIDPETGQADEHEPDGRRARADARGAGRRCGGARPPCSRGRAQRRAARAHRRIRAPGLCGAGRSTARRQPVEPDGPPAFGPRNLAARRAPACSATTPRASCFRWRTSGRTCRGPATRRATRATRARESIARGHDVFMFRTFWIRDSMHLNTVGLGNPIKRTCSTCHGMHMTGMDTANGWMDHRHHESAVGARSPAREPVERSKPPSCRCSRSPASADVTPHPFLGRVIYTQDPGPRADLGQVQRRRHDRDAAVPRTRRARAVFLERLGGDLARTRRLLRPALQHRLHRAGESRTSSTSWACCDERASLRPIALRRAGSHRARARRRRRPKPGERLNFVSCPIVRDTLRAVLARRVRRRALLTSRFRPT